MRYPAIAAGVVLIGIACAAAQPATNSTTPTSTPASESTTHPATTHPATTQATTQPLVSWKVWWAGWDGLNLRLSDDTWFTRESARLLSDSPFEIDTSDHTRFSLNVGG